MILYIGLTVFVCCTALLIKENCIKGTKQWALNKTARGFIVFLLFMLSACRMAVGNDYWVYKINFDVIDSPEAYTIAYEHGFKFVVLAMRFIFGKDCYRLIFALFAFVTILFFVKALEWQSEWFALSLFLVMTNGFYFSSFNSIRYYLVFAIALYSIRFVFEGRYTEFLFTIALAATMHKTVLVVIPAFLICKLKWKKPFILLLTLFSASLVFCRGLYRRIIFLFYPFYEGNAFDNYEISYANVLKAAAVIGFCLLFYKSSIRDNEKHAFYFKLNVLAFIVYTCCYFIPEYTRIGYYFSASHVFLLPGILAGIKDRKKKIFWSAVIIAAYGAYFVFFLKSCYNNDIRLLPYYSWVFPF